MRAHPLPGASSGYGFIKFVDDESAAKAIASLNGFQLHGKMLKVSIARHLQGKPIEKATLYVAGLPLTWTKVELEAMLAPFGAVAETKLLTDAMGASRGVGFVSFESAIGAQSALQLNGTKPNGCDKAIQIKVLFVVAHATL